MTSRRFTPLAFLLLVEDGAHLIKDQVPDFAFTALTWLRSPMLGVAAVRRD